LGFEKLGLWELRFGRGFGGMGFALGRGAGLGGGDLAVDAEDLADDHIAIDKAVFAARCGGCGLGGGGWRGAWRGFGRARGALAAEAVAERLHEGDVDGEPEQAVQRGPGGCPGFGRGSSAARGGRWRAGDWRFPKGGCAGHFRCMFYSR
jgi:hypothetical protein